MKKNCFGVVLVFFLLLVCFSGLAYCVVETSCTDAGFVTRLSSPGKLEIVNHPSIDENLVNRSSLEKIPPYEDTDAFWDFRSRDMTKLNIAQCGTDIFRSMFDTKTLWKKPLPVYFNPALLIQAGKNPGLGVRELHKVGINGTNIGIAIIDMNELLVDHQEYVSQLRLFEEVHALNGNCADMHAPAVASLAVGKSIGVAPSADLYFITATGVKPTKDQGWELDCSCFGDAIDRVREINRLLPMNKRIRVISVSYGWMPNDTGYAKAEAAVDRAMKDGIFVITASEERNYPKLKLKGLGREPYSNADNLANYSPGEIWKKYFYQYPEQYENLLLVPTDQRMECYNKIAHPIMIE
ncbi:MAG: S8/S53 family peptidase [Bacillota bacterium]